MNIIDVSIALDKKTLIYPGNVGLTVEVHQAMSASTSKSSGGTKSEHSTHLSKIIMGSHIGTHIDAPSHAVLGANTLDQIPLETLVGSCRVLDFTKSIGSIKTEELKEKNVKAGERILAKTVNSTRGFETFYDDYVYLDGDAADYLAELGIALFGIDYLSVKQRGSKDNRPHTSLLTKNIPIIEGLDLNKVSEGEYELVALPLKFVGIEGAPARVILIKRSNQ